MGTNEDIEKLIKHIENITADVVDNNMTVSWTKLQNEARYFLRSYNTLQQNEEMLQREQLHFLINNPSNKSNYIKGLRGGKGAYLVRAKYLLAFHFDKVLNQYLEDLPKEAIYSYEEKGEVKTYTLSMEKLAKYSTQEGKLRLSKNQLEQEQNRELEKDGSIPQEHVNQVRLAYTIANERLNNYYQQLGTSGSLAQGGFLKWKEGSKWRVGKVLNRGDLKEAYTAALLSQHKSKLDYLYNINDSEQLISAFYQKYIHEVTNKPAIVEEDVIARNKQFAVKSAKASLPGLQQYINTAKWIRSQKRLVKKEDVKKYIVSTYSQDVHRNNIVKTIEKLTQKELNALGLKLKY